jgi:type I restriction enzyme S subunit
MTQRREVVTVTGSFGDWTPITVHLTGEISARDRTAPFKGTIFAAYPGDIVFSKIDARSGAIGMLPPEIGKAVITPEFPVFTADPARLDSAFVKLVLRTGDFIAALRRKASGTSGRKRITPDAFQNLRIPLPPLPEQQAIVAAWRAALDHAAALEREATETETAAALAFESALGFTPSTPLPDRPVFVASFKDMDRWSHEGILRRIVDGTTTHASLWPMVRLSDVIADLENGWSPNCLSRQAEPDEWGVLKLGAVSFGTFDETENKALPKHLKPRPYLEVKTGQILISRANVTRLVGAISMIGVTRDKLMLCDKIFRVVPMDPAPVDSVFLTEVLRLPDLRRQIESKLTGTSPTMKNISKPALLGLTFPLPPLPEQQKMVQALTDARASGVQKREEAAKARAKAWADFETAVYSAEVVEDTTALIAAAS